VKDRELRVDVKSCTAGRYSTGSVDSCTSCGTGFSNVGASRCEYCGPGEYMHEEATTKECLGCEAGKYSETGASSIEGCFSCNTGKYSVVGSGYCATVEAGEEVVKDGELRVGAASCTAGRYSTGSADSCTSCGTGFSNAGASKCEYCGPGEYMHEAEDLTKSCLGCGAGKYSETGASSIGGCLACGTGKYSNAGSGYCATVEAGEEVVKVGELRVGAASCAAGRYSTGSSDYCLDCGVGTYSAASASFCPIAGGGFIPNEDQDGILPCPSGSYSSGTSDECLTCPPGYFSFPTSSSCSSCDPGHYFLDPPSETCVKVILWDQVGDGWDDNVLQFEMQGTPLEVYSFDYPKPSPYYPGAASVERDACFQAGRCYTGSLTEGPRHYQIQWSITDLTGEVRAQDKCRKRSSPLPHTPRLRRSNACRVRPPHRSRSSATRARELLHR
jgi:hypothetical protein